MALHRPWRAETDPGEAIGVREVGDLLDVDLPAPQISGRLALRRDRELGDRPIPPPSRGRADPRRRAGAFDGAALDKDSRSRISRGRSIARVVA